jgi:drug/metabolite transporter (DMT)-like permease
MYYYYSDYAPLFKPGKLRGKRMIRMSKQTDAAVSRGVMAILATVFAMALADAVVKLSSGGMSLWQIWVLRSALVIPVLLPLARKALWPEGLRWVLLRSAFLGLMYLGIYAAIPFLDLSVIAAALYTAPLFIVALSAVFLKEPILARHWCAIFLGFAGVLAVVRPFGSGFSPLAFLPVGAALLYSAAAILTRARCVGIRPATMALWLNLTFLVTGGAASLTIQAGALQDFGYAFLFGPWHRMGWTDCWVIVGLSVLMVGIAIGLAHAYQSPRPQVIATFDYAYLIFAAFWGYVFFGEVPDFWTIVGMMLIATAGLAVLFSPKPSDGSE